MIPRWMYYGSLTEYHGMVAIDVRDGDDGRLVVILEDEEGDLVELRGVRPESLVTDPADAPDPQHA